jgi:putative ABC transport system permease protein
MARQDDDELDRELEVHLVLEIEEQQKAGLTHRNAQLAAHRAFGSVALTKEELRDMRTGASFDRIGRELRHAGRRLIRTPAFTLAAVLTLALAIAANVAIFAVVHRVILNPLPYGESSRLLALDFSMPDRNVLSGISMTLALYYEYLDRARTLDGIAAYRADERTLAGGGIPERVRVARSTTSLSTVLQVSPAQGRWFTDAEGAPGGAPVAVVSHGLWVRRYGQTPEIPGWQVTLDEVPTTVIGVMPASFTFPDPSVDVWIPDPISRAIAASPASVGV